MPQESLRKNPLCRAEDLGKPIPPSPHAISMCLPRWRDVVGYEEKSPATMEKLHLGYPRFFYHPMVEAAGEKFRRKKDESIQLYATRNAAERCAAYLWIKEPTAGITIRETGDTPVHLISFPGRLNDYAKEYWQHAGEGISSRCAEALLSGAPLRNVAAETKKIKERIAELSGSDPQDIYLFPSGMAAIHAAYIAARKRRLEAPTVQFAFPYGDTLKLQNRFSPHHAMFYPRGDAEDLQQLERDLRRTAVSGLFCEFPTNPLLTCVDLHQLRSLANEHKFPLIIDETLGACINLDTLPMADLSAISLTKFFTGSSNVMGGALILNPEAPCADSLRRELNELHEPEAVFPDDIIEIEKDSRDCRRRVETMNATAMAICEFLAGHPAVESVFYPAFTDKEVYDRFRRPDGGYGGLFSFVLKDAARYTEAFYDALEITKGPNLGASFSLCCPFTLIAHYHELDWAEAAGASRYLIRISVGLEPADDLIARIQSAIETATR